ncbi:Uncharacterised protein [Serratia fonticola]|uniref:Uncharacterized protein n=1 Tax=Serratia fonticola TaxID=47917 RepID=A0A4U9UNZ8_SERFO|nr:Uncharacterised protein [Serratia fonticola]
MLLYFFCMDREYLALQSSVQKAFIFPLDSGAMLQTASICFLSITRIRSYSLHNFEVSCFAICPSKEISFSPAISAAYSSAEWPTKAPNPADEIFISGKDSFSKRSPVGERHIFPMQTTSIDLNIMRSYGQFLIRKLPSVSSLKPEIVGTN